MALPPDVAFLALRLLLVALIYLFLVMVVLAARRGAEPVLAAAPRAPRRLVVVDPGGSGLAAGLAIALGPATALGRAPDNTLVFADPAVSAHHARIARRDDDWWIEDLGSSNGTWVNGHALTGPLRVVAGDRVRLGTASLSLEG